MLEIGCGTVGIWGGLSDVISRCGKLILTDLSEGMLKKAKENLGEQADVEYQIADIQDFQFADESFDIVIANSMLYHVPNLRKGTHSEWMYRFTKGVWNLYVSITDDMGKGFQVYGKHCDTSKIHFRGCRGYVCKQGI